MRYVIILALASFSIRVALGDTSKRLHFKAVHSDTQIDGVIDPLWADADSVSDFFQLDRYYGQPPSVRTVAKVLTSPDAL